MSISSILFREQSDYYDTEANQPAMDESERQPRSLRRMLKPWPFPPAAQPARVAAEDDDEGYREPTPALVLDRLANFAARR